jgi:hypothetical protein
MTNKGAVRITTNVSLAEFGQAEIAAGKVAYPGLLALLDENGRYNPDAAVVCAGIIIEPATIDGYNNTSGSNGDKTLRFARTGRVNLDKSATAAPTDADVGSPLFAENDYTLGLQPYHATDVRPYVGRVIAVTTDEVEVELDPRVKIPCEELGPYRQATKQTLAAGTVIVIGLYQDIYPVAGSGGAVTLTADLPDGLYDGQEIELLGTHDTNVVNVPDNINTALVGDATAPLSKDASLRLRWCDANSWWREVSRAIVA